MVPPRFSPEPGSATWEKYLWTVELCWLTAMSRHVWEDAKQSGEQKKKKKKRSCDVIGDLADSAAH